MQAFYNKFGATNWSMIDVTAGKALMSKICEVAYAIMKELASNNYQSTSFERTMPKLVARVTKVD